MTDFNFSIGRKFATARSLKISPQFKRIAKAVITIAIRLRCDYDSTTTYRARLLPFDAIRREQKINMSIFRRSRVAVAS